MNYNSNDNCVYSKLYIVQADLYTLDFDVKLTRNQVSTTLVSL